MRRSKLYLLIVHGMALLALLASASASPAAASQPAPGGPHIIALTGGAGPLLAALNGRIPVLALGADALTAGEPDIRQQLGSARALATDVSALTADQIRQTAWFRLAHQLGVPIIIEHADAQRMAAITGFGQGGRLVVLRPSQGGKRVQVSLLGSAAPASALGAASSQDPAALASAIVAQLDAAPHEAAIPGNLPARAVRSWDITTGAWTRTIKGSPQRYTVEVNFSATLYDGVFDGQSRKMLVITTGGGAGVNATAGGALQSDTNTDRGYYLESLLVDVQPINAPAGLTLLSYAPAAENSEGTYEATTGLGVEGGIEGPPTISINHEQTETQQVKDFRVSTRVTPYDARWVYQLARVGDAIPYNTWADIVNNTHIQYPLFTLLSLPPLAKGETLQPYNQSVWTMPSDFQDQIAFRFTHRPTFRHVWRTTPSPGGWNFANEQLDGATVSVDWYFDFSQVNYRGDISVAAQDIVAGPAALNGTRPLSARVFARLADYESVTVGFYQGPPADPSSKLIGSTVVNLTQQFDWRFGGRIGTAVAQVDWNTAGLPGTQPVWVRIGKADGTPIDGELDLTNNIATRAINLAEPGVSLSNTAVSVIEGGATDTYKVMLNTQPATDVQIKVDSGSQAIASPKTLNFTTANWNIPQTVTLGAVDDSVAEGPHSASIGHVAASGDPSYNGIAIDPVTAAIIDNDNVSPTTVHVSQSGATDSYQLMLARQPSANVAVAITTDGKTTVSPATLNFTTANWNVPQTVVVSAVDNHDVEGPLTSLIGHRASSADPSYSNVDLSAVTAIVMDHSGEAAPINVTTAADTVAADGSCSLREAIQAANSSTPVNECAVSATAYHVIKLVAAGPYDLSMLNPTNAIDSSLIVSSTLTINGNGQTIRNRNPNGISRIFQVVNSGALTLNNLTIRDGKAFNAGGLWVFAGATANLYRTTVTHNEATAFGQVNTSGGGIVNQGTLNIYDSAITDNFATGNNPLNQQGGGGILNEGDLNIANSTIAGNRTNMSGGGIDHDFGTMRLTNVTIANNTADADGDGKGEGGGIAIGNGRVVIKNSIIASNFDTPNNAGSNATTPDLTRKTDIPQMTTFLGQLISGGYNLVGNVGTFDFDANSTGDRYGDPRGTTTPNLGATEQAAPINPRLGGLTGSPAYYPLQAGSPAIDRIPPARCAFASSSGNPLFADTAAIVADQRGGSRPRGLRCDMGAYEADQPGIAISGNSLDVPTGRLGGSYQLVLKKQPASNVTIQLAADGSTILDQPSLVFTPSNWAIPQTVNVTALHAPAKAAGGSTAAAGAIKHHVSSADPNYNALAIGDVSVTILDGGTAIGATIFLPLVQR